MSGWRIQLLPGVGRGAAGVKVDTHIAYGAPFVCRQCDRIEQTKHLHLRLDDQAATVVSQGVVTELERLGMIDTVFAITNEAVGPPQVVQLGGPVFREDFALIGTE